MSEEVVGFSRQDATQLLTFLTGNTGVGRGESKPDRPDDYLAIGKVKADIAAGADGTCYLQKVTVGGFIDAVDIDSTAIEIDNVRNASSLVMPEDARVIMLREYASYRFVAFRPMVGVYIESNVFKVAYFDGTVEDLSSYTCGT